MEELGIAAAIDLTANKLSTESLPQPSSSHRPEEIPIIIRSPQSFSSNAFIHHEQLKEMTEACVHLRDLLQDSNGGNILLYSSHELRTSHTLAQIHLELNNLPARQLNFADQKVISKFMESYILFKDMYEDEE